MSSDNPTYSFGYLEKCPTELAICLKLGVEAERFTSSLFQQLYLLYLSSLNSKGLRTELMEGLGPQYLEMTWEYLSH